VPVSEEVHIGTELLGYRVEELVGRGGMSVVYRATDLRLKRQVALKLLSPELARDEGFRRRFLTESEVAASLEHPHILPVYSAGEANGLLYIATRYVEDSDLKHLLRVEAPLDAARAIHLLGDVADALDVAHERGLIHRDVKPSNILISLQAGNEHAYLADFGLAMPAGDRASDRTAPIVGTIDYIAPEQIERDDVDARADVYGLGCVLYECLTGEVPFPRDSDLSALWAHMRTDPPRVTERRPELPRAIDTVLAKALAKDSRARFRSCVELVDAARDALGLSTLRVARRRTSLVLAAAGLVATVAVAAAFALDGGDRAPLALRGNTLVRVDAETNSVSAVIDVGEKPAAVAVAGRTAWVYNLGDGSVSQVDTSTNAVRRTTPVSTVPVNFAYHSGPVLAANSAGAWLVGIRRDGRGVLTLVGGDGRSYEYLLDSSPLAVTATDEAVWVLVSVAPRGGCPIYWEWGRRPLPANRRDAVVRFSPLTGRMVSRVSLDYCGISTGVTHDERSVWVFAMDFSTLIRIDARTARVTGEATEFGSGDGPGPSGGGVPASGGGAVWVPAIDNGGRVVRVDPATLRATLTISSVPARNGSTVYGMRSVWWNDAFEGVVLRFDPDTGKIVSSVRVAPESSGGPTFHSSAMAIGAGDLWATVTPAFIP
jgi:DNA-binding beta-propeller fold protein YncE